MDNLCKFCELDPIKSNFPCSNCKEVLLCKHCAHFLLKTKKEKTKLLCTSCWIKHKIIN